MAPPHIFVTTTILDAKGQTSSFEVKFPTSAGTNTTMNALIAAAQAIATLSDAIIRGQILDVGIGIKVDISGLTLKSSPVATADVEEGARFQFNTAAESLTGFRMPTFDEDFILSGSRVVDLEDVDVDAFVDLMTAGLETGGVTVQPSDERGSDITTIRSARENFVSSRN
jgi:uncharacterized protein YfcZ (UPF0381/DUF406 family)